MHIVSLFCNKIFICSFCINGILIFSYNVHILYFIEERCRFQTDYRA
jgi:hypothetical protein